MSDTNSETSAWRALTRQYHLPLPTLQRGLRHLTPSDWVVVAMLGFLMFISAGALLATASNALVIEIPAGGGGYTEGIVGAPRFVNPVLAISEPDRDLTKLVFSGLLKSNSDGTLSPDLASSYTISDNALTYTFILSERATFHNGSPVTATDVAFTIHAIQNPEIKSPIRANWEGVSITAIDERTISFTLKNPYAPFLENATTGILPHALWEGVSAEEFAFSTLNTKPVGSGPYRVANVKQNASGIPTEYRLKAFTRGTRAPFINHITFKIYQNADDLAAALKSGEVDSAHSIPPETSAALESVFGRVFGVFFNQNQNGVFADKAVRTALDRAVDKQAIVDTILSGYGSVIDGPLPPQTIHHSADVRSEDEHIEEAKAHLTEAGWKLGEDGIFVKKTKTETTRLAFSLSTANAPELKRAAEMVVADWHKLGAEVELRLFEQNDLNTSVLRPRKYDALLFGLVVGNDLDLFAFWHSSQRNDPGLNIALYASIDVDKKLEKARLEPELAERRIIAESAAETIRGEVAAVFLYTPHFVYLTPKNVLGISVGTITAPSDRFANVDEWYLAKERIWPIFKTKDK